MILSSSHPKPYKGFSLVELLVVLVVMTILLAIAIPSISTLNSTSLSGAGREFANTLSLCRSEAIAERTAVRFGVAIEGPNPEDAYRKYAVWKWNRRTRDYELASKWTILPENITFEPEKPIYIEDSIYAQEETTSVEGDYITDPEDGQEFEYLSSGDTTPHQVRFVQFSPSGRASIPGRDERNILLVMREGEPNVEPVNEVKNWVHVSIDTLTGRQRTYRP